MKTTNQFQKTIKAYLDKRASEDELFAKVYAKEEKSVEECCNYILTEVQRSGCNGFADEEIFGMAVHYYDEDNLGEIKPIHGNVVVNHKIELSDDEKAELKAKAENEYKQSIISELKRKEEEAKAKRIARQKAESEQQLSLF